MNSVHETTFIQVVLYLFLLGLLGVQFGCSVPPHGEKTHSIDNQFVVDSCKTYKVKEYNVFGLPKQDRIFDSLIIKHAHRLKKIDTYQGDRIVMSEQPYKYGDSIRYTRKFIYKELMLQKEVVYDDKGVAFDSVMYEYDYNERLLSKCSLLPKHNSEPVNYCEKYQYLNDSIIKTVYIDGEEDINFRLVKWNIKGDTIYQKSNNDKGVQIGIVYEYTDNQVKEKRCKSDKCTTTLTTTRLFDSCNRVKSKYVWNGNEDFPLKERLFFYEN